MEQFMDKCLWGNLKTRLAFEERLTINRIMEVAEEIKSEPLTKSTDYSYQNPSADKLFGVFRKDWNKEINKAKVRNNFLNFASEM